MSVTRAAQKFPFPFPFPFTFVGDDEPRRLAVEELRSAAESLRFNHAASASPLNPRDSWDPAILAVATSKIDPTTSLDALLHAYLYVHSTFTGWSVAQRIVVDFAEAHFTFDQLITATAALCVEYPDMQHDLAIELLRDFAPLDRTPQAYFACVDLPLVAFSVATLNSDPISFLTAHAERFTPPITDDQLGLAKVLLLDWFGSLATLVETIQRLRPNVAAA
jgi:hypothetical protein